MQRKTLKTGDYGDDVKQINYMLQSLKYKVSDMHEFFDKNTHCAVVSFQNDYGMDITGTVDEQTWQALERKIAKETPADKPADGTIGSNSASSEKTDEISASWHNEDSRSHHTVLKIGSEGPKVVELQKCLEKLGYPIKKIDGIFGKNTLESVYLFQDLNNIKADGIVGKETWDTLEKYDAMPMTSKQMKPAKQAINYDDCCQNIKELQKLLAELGLYNGPLDGIFGSKTNAAVKLLKKRYISPTDNAVDKIYKPILKLGSRGEDVIELQKILKKLGYYYGSIDGVFGVNTETCVKAFQKDSGLVVDGISGVKTWKALESSFIPEKTKDLIPISFPFCDDGCIVPPEFRY